MIISDLEILEVVEVADIQGGRGRGNRKEFDFLEKDKVVTIFDTTNKFKTVIKAPDDVKNISAAAGAKGVADVGDYEAYTYTKADTLAVTDAYGNSFSSSNSAALISF
jgi:hypothetical protein